MSPRKFEEIEANAKYYCCLLFISGKFTIENHMLFAKYYCCLLFISSKFTIENHMLFAQEAEKHVHKNGEFVNGKRS